MQDAKITGAAVMLTGGIAGGGKGAGAGTAAAKKRVNRFPCQSETFLEFCLEQPTELPIAK